MSMLSQALHDYGPTLAVALPALAAYAINRGWIKDQRLRALVDDLVALREILRKASLKRGKVPQPGVLAKDAVAREVLQRYPHANPASVDLLIDAAAARLPKTTPIPIATTPAEPKAPVKKPATKKPTE